MEEGSWEALVIWSPTYLHCCVKKFNISLVGTFGSIDNCGHYYHHILAFHIISIESPISKRK